MFFKNGFYWFERAYQNVLDYRCCFWGFRTVDTRFFLKYDFVFFKSFDGVFMSLMCLAGFYGLFTGFIGLHFGVLDFYLPFYWVLLSFFKIWCDVVRKLLRNCDKFFHKLEFFFLFYLLALKWKCGLLFHWFQTSFGCSVFNINKIFINFYGNFPNKNFHVFFLKSAPTKKINGCKKNTFHRDAIELCSKRNFLEPDSTFHHIKKN